MATLPLLQAVLDQVHDRPVLAAVGIGTGRGLVAILAARSRLWCGTAFLAWPEAANNPAARAGICAAHGEQTIYTRVFHSAQQIPWSAPYAGRALANEFTDRWRGQEDALAANGDAAAQLAAAKRAAQYRIAHLYAGQGVDSVAVERSAVDVIAALTETGNRAAHRMIAVNSDHDPHSTEATRGGENRVPVTDL
jgi:nitronate monooxygenase